MRIYNQILGNIFHAEWRDKLAGAKLNFLNLDQWTAQKSRFTVKDDNGVEHAISLKRQTQILDGDVIDYSPATNRATVIRIALNEVMVIDLGELLKYDAETMIRTAVETGHAVGNQHWPAVVKGTEIYVPLTVDRRVMESVMETHRIEHVRYSFISGNQVIPHLAPHEIRRLFGGTEPHAHDSRSGGCAIDESHSHSCHPHITQP